MPEQDFKLNSVFYMHLDSIITVLICNSRNEVTQCQIDEYLLFNRSIWNQCVVRESALGYWGL